ncbi:60S ribosomal protein L29 [Claviceps purpurea]|nr:60S ribosomal protein L29 [Claviceps purpurea]
MDSSFNTTELVASPASDRGTAAMAKSKNSSQHNQWAKAHRNGIKKPKTSRYPSLKGTDPKFRRNHRHALHGTAKALKEAREGKRETV